MTNNQYPPPEWGDGGRHRKTGIFEDITFWTLAVLVVALLIAGNWILA